MPKYFSDPNMNPETLDGSLLERQYLLGSLGGTRSRMAEKGLILDGGVTQDFQNNQSGDGDSNASSGSLDIWAAHDTGRTGWWSKGWIVAHVEANWGGRFSRWPRTTMPSLSRWRSHGIHTRENSA